MYWVWAKSQQHSNAIFWKMIDRCSVSNVIRLPVFAVFERISSAIRDSFGCTVMWFVAFYWGKRLGHRRLQMETERHIHCPMICSLLLLVGELQTLKEWKQNATTVFVLFRFLYSWQCKSTHNMEISYELCHHQGSKAYQEYFNAKFSFGGHTLFWIKLILYGKLRIVPANVYLDMDFVLIFDYV